MESYFAPAERASKNTLIDQSHVINQNEVMDGLLETVGGLLAILNTQRQIVSLNDSLLGALGLDNPMDALGLRPGEALKCVHADEQPGGCGTSKFCSTCGAGKAIMSSIQNDEPFEDICALTAHKDGQEVDVALQVRSHPIVINNSTYLLVFMQDITRQQQRAALERTFFHDINNMLSGLVGASEILSLDKNKSPMVDIVRRSSLRLQKTIEIQRSLLECETGAYTPVQQNIRLSQIRDDLVSLFANHPARDKKHLDYSQDLDDFVILTDISLFERVLSNMITNALEASDEGGTVRVSASLDMTSINFLVHNQQVIPEDVRLRVFQRNFSTKGRNGRGIGTYSMKMFGEKILGGKVSFTSSPAEGTIFKFSLPV